MPNGVDKARFNRFASAIEAMQLLETDREPIQVEGYMYLFIGSIGELSIHLYSIVFEQYQLDSTCFVCMLQVHLLIMSPYARTESHM